MLDEVQEPYTRETYAKVATLVSEETDALKELGDLLARCRALANNRNAPPKDRVISIEAKAAIDKILEVSSHTEITDKADQTPLEPVCRSESGQTTDDSLSTPP